MLDPSRRWAVIGVIEYQSLAGFSGIWLLLVVSKYPSSICHMISWHLFLDKCGCPQRWRICDKCCHHPSSLDPVRLSFLRSSGVHRFWTCEPDILNGSIRFAVRFLYWVQCDLIVSVLLYIALTATLQETRICYGHSNTGVQISLSDNTGHT